MGVALEQSEESSTIRLEGAIDIGLAADLREALLKALTTGGELRVSLGDATDLDVTVMQLLWAARRMAEASDVRFALVGQIQNRVTAALAAAGLEKIAAGVAVG